MKPSQLEQHVSEMVALSQQLAGHLSRKEAAFLAVLPFVPLPGEILEIGSFKGKSTVILAKSLLAAGGTKLFACDPLCLPCETDPTDAKREELPEIFRQNIRKNGVADAVEMHQMRSSELAATWNRPLRVLWIDGDHTYAGATQDLQQFQPRLVPGGIACLHDVLHEHEGPLRAFIEGIVLSPAYADCGLCGSIGWGQYVGPSRLSQDQWKAKLDLYRRLSPLVPFVVRWSVGLSASKWKFKLLRRRVPHAAIDPVRWLRARSAAAECHQSTLTAER